MNDKLGNKLEIGSKVCFAPAGAYAGVCLGIVEKFTPKRVCIVSEEDVKGRHIDTKRYYAHPKEILVYEIKSS